ncbi:MAG: hypothetical protein WC877_00685 [Dehalococcoidales bacterium]|jgi:hypothetical protein
MGYNKHVQCTTCNHPRSEEINKDLYERKLKLVEICEKYGNYVSTCALSTHRSNHMKNYVPKQSVPRLNDQITLGVFGDEPIKQRCGAKVNDCVTHVSRPLLNTPNPPNIPICASSEKKSIDDLIIETKVKQIVLITLKELGICQ